jgi:hypothetical protein
MRGPVTRSSTRVRVAERVVEQVRQHALQRDRVAFEVHRSVGDDVQAHCARLDRLGRPARDRGEVHRLARVGLVRVLRAREREQVADEPVEVRGLVLGARERALVADPALDRLQRAAQGEQRRAQVVRDRRDQEAALALGGGRRAERALERRGHAAHRLAHLRDLAGGIRPRD